ncbi:hypothetical protein ACP6L2_00925 [Sphingobacterium lactis]|uniref:8-oxoguanine DNA glycosylase OGG fold protein n=1 Tax=Sphingobacterium lactis TaxID=797291 RepID=UPI003F7D418D
MNTTPTLLNKLGERNIFNKVIPTVNTFTNLFNRLDELGWNFHDLKQWEKPIYKAFKIEEIKPQLVHSSGELRSELIKQHLLHIPHRNLGAHPVCIYLVAYYFSMYKPNGFTFFDFISKNGISNRPGSAQAIWDVGRSCGEYLGIFRNKFEFIDWDFFLKWQNPIAHPIEKAAIEPLNITSKEKKDKVRFDNILEYFLAIQDESKPFTGPNSLSWIKFVVGKEYQNKKLDRSLYRDDLLDFCEDTNNADFDCLLAILSWGGMHREHGKDLLKEPSSILDITFKLRNNYFATRQDAFEYIQEKRKLGLLPGLGIGYFTKLICFLAPQLNGYIMDQWVAKSINLITRKNITHIDKIGWVTDKNNKINYENFCSEIDQIAQKLNISGYKAEEKLFSIGGRNKGKWRKFVVESYETMDFN